MLLGGAVLLLQVLSASAPMLDMVPAVQRNAVWVLP
jgi:hypothetical protein